MPKVKNDGNAQPAKKATGNTGKIALAALNSRIKELAKVAKNAREMAQVLLYDSYFFALGVGDGNLQPLANTIKASKGLADRSMVQWCEKELGVERFKNKDTGEEGFKATPRFAEDQAAFKKDKSAFGKKVKAAPRYWEMDKQSAFEEIDLINLIRNAANKVDKYHNDPSKKDRVKHAELIPSIREWLNEHSDKDEDEGDEGEGNPSLPAEIRDADTGEMHALN